MEERYPDATPFGPGDGDIERAAAAAAEQAADHGPRNGSEAGGGPRRWLVVSGVAVAVLALAGTATALATHKPPHSDVAAVAGDASSTSATTSPSLQDSSSDIPSPTPSATMDETTMASPTTTTTRTKPSPTKSPTTLKPTTTASNSLDCESESHDTPADAAMAFSGMQPGAQAAFLAAKAASQEAGIKSFILNSGYRSAAYQQRVFDCWVAELGSPQAARQYALPPSESAHVKGYAMDIAPPNAAAWLQSTAGKFGLCRRYADETWHFEYQASYKTDGCPALLPHP